MGKNKYQFDLDSNGILALTEKNVALIHFIVENDSNYRSPISVEKYIKDKPIPWDEKEILDIVTIIDRQNSTHQEAIGVKKDESNPNAKNNGGRLKTAEYICAIDRLYERLEIGDASLVNEIAKALFQEEGDGRYTFSFASKFCTYVSQALYQTDAYSVYDKVLHDILPYYAWAYLGERRYFAKKKSRVDVEFGISKRADDSYKRYRDFIDAIRRRSEELTGYQISRRDFDLLLWYYFKGDRDIEDKRTKEKLYTSRTTRALEHIGDIGSVLRK